MYTQHPYIDTTRPPRHTIHMRFYRSKIIFPVPFSSALTYIYIKYIYIYTHTHTHEPLRNDLRARDGVASAQIKASLSSAPRNYTMARGYIYNWRNPGAENCRRSIKTWFVSIISVNIITNTRHWENQLERSTRRLSMSTSLGGGGRRR